jgi:hypothetical protein
VLRTENTRFVAKIAVREVYGGGNGRDLLEMVENGRFWFEMVKLATLVALVSFPVSVSKSSFSVPVYSLSRFCRAVCWQYELRKVPKKGKQ